MVIKVENNLKEILQYLEVLNYVWNSGEKPTEYEPNCIYCLIVQNNRITHDIDSEGISFEEFKKQNPIQKRHLRSGMVVEYADGERRLVIDFMGELILISNEGFYSLHAYREDLTCYFHELVINKVFIVSPGNLIDMLSEENPYVQIWERPNPVTEVTMEEIAKKFNISIEQLKIKK